MGPVTRLRVLIGTAIVALLIVVGIGGSVGGQVITVPGVIPAFPLLAPNGTAPAPSYSFASTTNSGFFQPQSGNIYTGNGVNGLGVGGFGTGAVFLIPSITGTGSVALPSLGRYAWTAGANEQNATDTGLSRTAAGTVAVGNGTQGDISGSLSLSGITATGNITAGALAGFALGVRDYMVAPAVGVWVIENNATTIGAELKVDALPTISSGFGTSPAITAGSTPFAGSVNVGTGGTATSGVLNFAGTAYPSAPFCTASPQLTNGVTRVLTSTTQLTLTTTTAWTASDIVNYICVSSK